MGLAGLDAVPASARRALRRVQDGQRPLERLRDRQGAEVVAAHPPLCVLVPYGQAVLLKDLRTLMRSIGQGGRAAAAAHWATSFSSRSWMPSLSRANCVNSPASSCSDTGPAVGTKSASSDRSCRSATGAR